jgi:hypothetical protein
MSTLATPLWAKTGGAGLERRAQSNHLGEEAITGIYEFLC